MPFVLALAGGTLIYVTSNEIIPESHSHGNEGTASAGLVPRLPADDDPRGRLALSRTPATEPEELSGMKLAMRWILVASSSPKSSTTTAAVAVVPPRADGSSAAAISCASG